MFFRNKIIKIFIILTFIFIFSFQVSAATSAPEIKSFLIDKFSVQVQSKKVNGITFYPFLNEFGFTADQALNKDNLLSEFTTFIEVDNKLYKLNSAFSHFEDNKWYWKAEAEIAGSNVKLTHVFELKELDDNKDLSFLNMKVIISADNSLVSLNDLNIYNEIPASDFNKLEESIIISNLNKKSGINSFLALFDYTENIMLEMNSENDTILIGRRIKLNNSEEQKTVWESNLINVNSWEKEVVNNLVKNLKNYQLDTFPELNVFGFTEQKEVKQGDVVSYNYYIMNTGMEAASNIRLDVDIAEGLSYLENSSTGDQGTLILEPLGKEKKILKPESEKDLIINDQVRSLVWEIAGEIKTAEIKVLNFKVKVK